MSGFFGGTQLPGIPVFYHMHCLERAIQSEVSTTLKLSPRLSFIPIHLQVYNYFIGTVAFTFHKTAATVGLETNPTLAATRNETGRNNYQTLPIVIRTEH